MSPPSPAAPSAQRHCLNCNALLTGRYCAACGQEDHPVSVPLHRLILDFLSDQFQFDSRIWRTLHLLLFRPGHLTRAYLAGQRQRFIPPVRLYLFVTIVFFVVLSFSPPDLFHPGQAGTGVITTLPPAVMTSSRATALQGTAQPPSSASASALGKAFDQHAYTAERNHAPASATTAHPLVTWVNRNVAFVRSHRREFIRRFWRNAPRVLFFLLPIFALLLKVLYLLRRRYYSEHLIFTLHYHSVVFLNLFVILLLTLGAKSVGSGLSHALGWIAFAVWVWTWIYVFPALRAVYNDTWPRAIIRGCSLLFLYNIVLSLGVAAAVLVTLVLGNR